MKEVIFIKKNLDKWRNIGNIIEDETNYAPFDIARAYEEVSSDLAYVRTHYPMSDIIPYLNSMALNLHVIIYGNKQHRLSQIKDFWMKTIPLEIYKQRNMMLLALVVFVVSVIIGALSTYKDPSFVRLILGDRYVDMTLQNIEMGKPTSVYASDVEGHMFLTITLNNIRVSFNTFASGLLTSFCTGFLVLYNGAILGAFLSLFDQHGVLTDCLLAVWLHGVIEISSLIVGGGAGFVLGKGWMFPGSYTRTESFKRCAKSAVKIIIGTVPLYIIAGFIESFITRHTEWPVAVRLGIIILSLTFICFYFVYLPWKNRKLCKE